MPLASNQIQYSLLYRVPESNGVIEACNEAGATVIAYSPLAQGLLTGAFAARLGRPWSCVNRPQARLHNGCNHDIDH